jgi:hypothetical protein
METKNKYQNTPFLLIFAFFYTAITLFFINDLNNNQSASLGYLFIFPIFWIIAGIILIFSIKYNKIKIKGALDILILSFSTPIPLFIFLFFSHLSSPSSHINSTSEYDKNGKRFKEIEYVYSNLKIERKEIYTSRGYGWNKDSIWVYYDKDGKVLKKENYTQNKGLN